MIDKDTILKLLSEVDPRVSQLIHARESMSQEMRDALGHLTVEAINESTLNPHIMGAFLAVIVELHERTHKLEQLEVQVANLAHLVGESLDDHH